MSGTSPTPNEGSGQTPTPKPQLSIPGAPEPQSAPLNALTPPTQPDLQQEPVRTTHRIMGQRLVITYETVQLGDQETLTAAEMRLLPPLGSSSTRSAPYTILPYHDDLRAQSRLTKLLHELRDSSEPLKDGEIIQQLSALNSTAKTFVISYGEMPGYSLRGELSQMTFLAPPFQDLHKDLDRIEALYMTSRVQNGVYQTCECRIDPKHNGVWVHFGEADSSHHLRGVGAVACYNDLLGLRPNERATRLNWKNLVAMSEETMKMFVVYGARCTESSIRHTLFHNDQSDEKDRTVTFAERLRLGLVQDAALDTVVTLPSGGRAVLDVDDEMALLCISASDHEDCSTFCFVFKARPFGLASVNWEGRVDEIRSLMRRLVDTEAVEQELIIKRLAEVASYRSYDRCTISHIVGDQAAENLAALDEAGCLKVWLPNTSLADGPTDLLWGQEPVELTLAHFSGTQTNLAAFSSAQLLVSAAGGIEICLKNQLRNQLQVVLSKQAVTNWGGVGRVITSLAYSLSTRNIAQAHIRVHQLLEKMASPGSNEASESEKSTVTRKGFPPNNEQERRTFAAALAIVQAAHSASNCYGSHEARWVRPSHSVASVWLVTSPYAIEFKIEDEAISEVSLQGKPFFSQNGGESCFATLRFALPSVAVPLLLTALPEIFADYYQYGGPLGYSSRESETIQRTKIFQFLTAHAQRLVGEQRAAGEGDEADS